MRGNPRHLVASLAVALPLLVLAGCRQAKEAGGFLAGQAKVQGTQVVSDPGAPPRAIYVSDFSVAPGAIQKQGGILGAAEQTVDQRQGILGGGLLGGGGGGILERRTAPDNPTAGQVVEVLATSIVQALNAENLGFPAERIAPGFAPPSSGWMIQGQFASVDPGNRVQRAVIGFGAGEATTEVDVEVDRLGPGSVTPVLRFGSQADSGHAPGAAVTMNPYAAAAKFVLGRNATTRDIQKMGEAIAKEIAKYARERGVAAPAS